MKINVVVKPNSGKSEVEKISKDSFKVYLKSAPENNKANIELLKVLKKYFKKDVCFCRGLSSRKKVLEVFDGKI